MKSIHGSRGWCTCELLVLYSIESESEMVEISAISITFPQFGWFGRSNNWDLYLLLFSKVLKY